MEELRRTRLQQLAPKYRLVVVAAAVSAAIEAAASTQAAGSDLLCQIEGANAAITLIAAAAAGCENR